MHAKPNRDTVPKVINGRINGRFAPGFSGNPGGSPEAARKALNADTIRELHDAFRRGGRKAIDKVMNQNPAMFLKMLVLLVPRELQVEHSGGVKAMTDEQLETAVEALKAMLAAREAKTINGEAQPVEALPAPHVVPDDKAKRPNKVMDAADTAIGPCKPRKRRVPSPPGA